MITITIAVTDCQCLVPCLALLLLYLKQTRRCREQTVGCQRAGGQGARGAGEGTEKYRLAVTK